MDSKTIQQVLAGVNEEFLSENGSELVMDKAVAAIWDAYGTSAAQAERIEQALAAKWEKVRADWEREREKQEIERDPQYIAEHDAWFKSLDWTLTAEQERARISMELLDAADVQEELHAREGRELYNSLPGAVVKWEWQCMECAHVFKSVRAAERAMEYGCPNCHGVDIDFASLPLREHSNAKTGGQHESA